jgi:hypothetical protein
VDGSITSNDIQNGTIQLVDLDLNSVDGSTVIDGSLTGQDIQNNSIDATTKLSTSCADNQILQASSGNFVCANQNAGSDNLGDHVATQNLDLGSFQLVGNGGTSGISIANNGNVGIGTTTPAMKLHVIGDARFQDAYVNLDIKDNNSTSIADSGGSLNIKDSSDNLAFLMGIPGSDGNAVMTNYNANGAIKFQTAGVNERMIIDKDGNVGIGTTTPGLISGKSKYLTISSGNLNNVGKAALEIQYGANFSPGTDAGIIDFIANSTTGSNYNVARIASQTGSSTAFGQLGFYTGGFGTISQRMLIDQNGNIGIGTTTPTTELEVNGTVLANNFTTPSDIKFKDDRKPIKNSLKRIKSLTGYEYVWNETSRLKAGEKAMGLIAQEVERVFPLLVNIHNQGEEDEYRSVNYQGLVAPLINSVKELDDKVNEEHQLLYEEIVRLKNENESLKEKLYKIESLLLKLARD